jgi:hypothetical protein
MQDIELELLLLCLRRRSLLYWYIVLSVLVVVVVIGVLLHRKISYRNLTVKLSIHKNSEFFPSVFGGNLTEHKIPQGR